METDARQRGAAYRRISTLLVVMTIALVPLSGLGAAQAAGAAGNQSYVAVQDGDCVPITSFEGDESVRSFYDYRLPAEFADNPYINTTGDAFGSEGTINLQEPDTSTVFLYTDTGNDTTSLVFVHGAEGNESSDGGAATFTVTDLPEDGNWTVRDDDYNDTSNEDVWNVTDTQTEVDWLWGDAATDGGAYTGLGDDANVTIEPAFNEDAALADSTNGTVEQWQVLSNESTNTSEDVTRTDLDLNESLQIAAGSCEDVDGDAGDGTGFESADGENDTETDTEDNETNETATVEFDDQESDGTTVTVQNVTVPSDGYVAIHNDSLLEGDALGSVVGVSEYLEAGEYDNLTVELFDVPGADFNESELTEDQTLIAMPHEETNGDETYDFVSSNGTDDGPFTDAGQPVTDDALVTVVNDTNETDDTVTDDNVTDTPTDDNVTDTPEDDTATDTPEDDTPTDTPTDDNVTDTPEDDTATDTPADDATDTPADDATDTPADDGGDSNGPLIPSGDTTEDDGTDTPADEGDNSSGPLIPGTA
jgi:hypothetical protein